MSLRLRLLTLALRATVKPQLRALRDPVRARQAFDLLARYFLAAPRDARLSPDPVTGGLRADPSDRHGAAGAILYLHGGGYIAGSPTGYRGLLARLAAATGLPVHAPGYRLAPEHPLPAALEDVRASWEALAATLRPGRIALMGDSAGGGLALSLLSDLCRAGTPPAALVGLSAWADLTGTGPSIHENAGADPLLPAERFSSQVAFALGGHPAEDPRVSPLFAAYPGCPPVLLLASTTEILRDDSTRLAARLQAQGAPVTLRLWPGVPHAWLVFGRLPESAEALELVARFLSHAVPRQDDN